MKKSLILIVFALIFTSTSVLAISCDLDATLVNQDPYPAIPGDEVKLVFQIDGINNADCGTVEFELLEEFPVKLRPGDSGITSVDAGVYARTFKSFFLASYNVILDENALDGENRIEASLRGTGAANIIQEFNLTVEDARADFEVSIKDYVASTRELTFEILNIGESDIESLTIEIPKQEGVEIKGSNRNIVGALDSNEDTTFSFEAIPSDGEIKVNIVYTDLINVRRSLEKTVDYDSSYFSDRVRDQNGGYSTSFYVLVVVILLVLFFWWRARRKAKMHHHARHQVHHKK
tara:strand:+ start:1654 stop:2526 length:873 start_codon:yes stop_codon:yes gene_type:complete